MAFLGHVITKDGMVVDPTKVEVLSQWQQPKMVIEIQNFLGLTSYHKRFIISLKS